LVLLAVVLVLNIGVAAVKSWCLRMDGAASNTLQKVWV
jgi:hypothetical protein